MSAEDDVTLSIIERVEKLEERVAQLEGKKRKPGGAKTEGSEVFEAYAKAIYLRYSTEVPRTSKLSAMCKTLVSWVGKDAAIELVKFYTTQNDYRYTISAHKLDLLIADYQKLLVQIQSGNKVTRAQAKQLEDADSNIEAVKSYARKKHERNNQDGGEQPGGSP